MVTLQKISGMRLMVLKVVNMTDLGTAAQGQSPGCERLTLKKSNSWSILSIIYYRGNLTGVVSLFWR